MKKNTRKERKWKYSSNARKRRYCASADCERRLSRSEPGPYCTSCYKQLEQHTVPIEENPEVKNGE